MSGAEDEPRSTAPSVHRAVENLVHTFAGAGTDVHDAASRERFADEHRWLREQRAIAEDKPRASAFDTGFR